MMTKTKLSTGLRSERLYLRSFEVQDSDLEALYRWENDPETWESSSSSNPISSEFLRTYVLESVTSLVTRGDMTLAIALSDSDELIGYLQFLGYDAISRRVGYGLYIAPEYRRQGYAREVISISEAYAFQTLGVRLLYADILASNVPCCKLFEGLGYTLQASLPQWHWAAGKWHDLNYYMKWNNQ